MHFPSLSSLAGGAIKQLRSMTAPAEEQRSSAEIESDIASVISFDSLSSIGISAEENDSPPQKDSTSKGKGRERRDKIPFEPFQASRRHRTKSGPFPFLKLFQAEKSNPLKSEAALRHIRHHVYSYVWTREREVPNSADFHISHKGVSRNVRRPRHKDSSLLFVNRIIAQDYAEYLYGVSTIEFGIQGFIETPKTSRLSELQRRGHPLMMRDRLRAHSSGWMVRWAKEYHVVIKYVTYISSPGDIRATFMGVPQILVETINECWLPRRPRKLEGFKVIVISAFRNAAELELHAAEKAFRNLAFQDWKLYAKGYHQKSEAPRLVTRKNEK